MTPVTEPEFEVDSGAVAVINGRDGVGQVLAHRACLEAVRRAKKHGIHEEGFSEPRPTVSMSDLAGGGSAADDDASEDTGEGDAARSSKDDNH